MVHLKAKAPRLQAFLEKGIEHTVLITPREQWDLLNVGSTEMVEIDVRLCPISGVEQNAKYSGFIRPRIPVTSGQ